MDQRFWHRAALFACWRIETLPWGPLAFRKTLQTTAGMTGGDIRWKAPQGNQTLWQQKIPVSNDSIYQHTILNSFLEAGPRVSDSIRQQATSNLFIDKLSQLAYVKYIEKYD